MPDCTRCRCPLPSEKWTEHDSLEGCVKALGLKVNPVEVPATATGWPAGAMGILPPQQGYCPACGARVYVNALHLCTQHA